MTGQKALRDKLLTEIDQLAIDNAASELYPNATAATRNRQFYTPVSAVLKHGGIDKRFKRPKGWRGDKSTSWLEPEQAFALFRAADCIGSEFGLFLRVHTGMRLGDALSVQLSQVNLERARARKEAQPTTAQPLRLQGSGRNGGRSCRVSPKIAADLRRKCKCPVRAPILVFGTGPNWTQSKCPATGGAQFSRRIRAILTDCHFIATEKAALGAHEQHMPPSATRTGADASR